MRVVNCRLFVPRNRRARMSSWMKRNWPWRRSRPRAVAEEDLVPFASPGEGMAYWQHVSHLISRSWARQVRGIRRTASSETVKVRFKMFPNGRAQLIEIEKGSGAREIDEAGIYAVVNAQPFLPFPSELGDDVVDVHVRMRIGSRVRSLAKCSRSGVRQIASSIHPANLRRNNS